MNQDAVKSNVTRFIVGALGYCAGRYHLSGDQVLAIASDGGTIAAFLYGAYQHWGMKRVPETAVVVPATSPAVAK
jgi:hypothetical protein